MAKTGLIQSVIAIIKNISNQLIKIDHKQRLFICLLIIILIASILFKLFFWQKYKEGIDDTVTLSSVNSATRTMPQSKLNVIFTDKTNKSSTQKYQIYTEYDKIEYDKYPDTFPYSTFIADSSGANVNITMSSEDTTLTIEPMQDPSLNTINDSSLNTINDSSLNAINDSSLNVATFPKSMEIVLNFDKTGSVYYLKNQMSIDKSHQNKFSKTNPGEIEISSISIGGFILNSNYEQIGMMANDNFNPYKYTLKITDSTGVSKINIKFTTKAPV